MTPVTMAAANEAWLEGLGLAGAPAGLPTPWAPSPKEPEILGEARGEGGGGFKPQIYRDQNLSVSPQQNAELKIQADAHTGRSRQIGSHPEADICSRKAFSDNLKQVTHWYKSQSICD